MQIKINHLPESQIEIDFELSWEEFESYNKKSLSEIKENFEIDGYRKGRVPEEKIIEHLGEEKIMAEGANLAIQGSFEKAVLENKLEVISRPEADIVKFAKGNPFQFKIKICILPKIDLPNYEDIIKKIEKKETRVDSEEIEKALKWIQNSRAKFSLKDSPAQKGDFLEIEYSINNSGENYKDGFILGEGGFFPGVEESLIGMKNNEEKKGIATKTKEGKDVLINIKVISVKKMEIPELTDEFIKTLGAFENLENLKNNIREGLIAEKKEQEKQNIRAKIIENILKETNFEAPRTLKEKEEATISERFKKGIKESMGISFEEYLKKLNKKEEEIKDSFKKEADKKVKGLLILREIAIKEKIEADNKEIEEEAQKMLNHYDKKPDISPEELRNYIKEILTREKTFQFLENFI